MMKLFLRFLKEIFNIEDNNIALCLNCYTDIHTLEEIEDFWFKNLKLPRDCARKHTVNYYSSYSKKKRKGKLKYGMCSIIIYNTQAIQQIFRAIQEIAGFKEDGSWLK